MKKSELVVGKNYYYAKYRKVFTCIEAGKETSKFEDYRGHEYQFYNEDIYRTQHKGVLVNEQIKSSPNND